MKKLFKLFLVCVPMFFLVSCGGGELSEKYNEGTLKEASESLISNINAGKYEKITEINGDEIKDVLNVDKLKEVFDPVKEKVGIFDKVEKEIIKEKDGIAIIVTVAKYEKGKLQFTQSYNENMKLVGLYVK